MTYHVYGIRHHGPGSARSLVNALTTQQPDLVLIEGPPEADDIIPLTAHSQMNPPVSILVYAPDEPTRAVYYPFALFSPEWQAMRYALSQNVPVRFMDLPVSLRLAMEKEQEQSQELSREQSQELSPEQQTDLAADLDGDKEDDETEQQVDPLLAQARLDPLSLLANAAGYEDSERWWEHMVEERRDSASLFQGIAEAMTALRDEVKEESSGERSRIEALREAHMRKTIRAAEKQGFQNIAVVCGAWHVPALQNMPASKADNDLLKNLPRLKTVATWVPWSYGRLTYASGYGAGINSPGWYHHLWDQDDKISVRWLTTVARTFREYGMDVSSAHIIESVRLADSLAAMRGRPLAGLSELNDAAQSVMLFGDALPMKLLETKLIIGERLGQVPDETPMTPLQKDLAQEQKRLRLKTSASDSELILDLRKPTDLQRSYLLRQLRLIGVPWGQGGNEARGKGTFKESWQILWKPEFEIKLIEAGRWGNTIKTAANAATIAYARDCDSLETLAKLAQDALFADLDTAVDVLMQQLQAEAALAADIVHLMAALPGLAHLLRYGDVRKTSLDQVQTVVSGIVTRVCVGLPNACSSLNEEAAEAMYQHIQSAQEAIALLDNSDYTGDWQTTLSRLLDQKDLHMLLAGRCCRLLLQAGAITDEEAARRFGLALSLANDPADAAAWADGFLRGSGQLLIYDESLWNILDQWVCQLPPQAFTNLLPVLRRTFSTFEAPIRRQMGERVKHNKAVLPGARAANSEIDAERARTVLPLMARLLGLEEPHGVQ